MKPTICFLTGFALIFIFPFGIHGQQTIKIMPLGNSITQGYTYEGLPEEQLKGYRFDLKQLLQGEGYSIDFVGSESSGSAYFTDSQHAGIGGSRDQYVARLLVDGYDERWGVQIINPPGPYLDEFDPDIILLHIGSNDVTHEDVSELIDNQKVSDILDLIDQYEIRSNREVVVFLALIINRKQPCVAGSGCYNTSLFNDAIKAMALERIANGDKLVIVDMEHDAGFVYDETDMVTADNVHPNEVGYLKMANLWNSSIVNNYNTEPVISNIPDQSFDEGGISETIPLDDYVTDLQDADQNLTWTITQLETTNLNITQNANRQVTASPVDDNWNGTQTVVFKVTDNGKNGKYVKSATDTVIFTIRPVNDVPIITSSPTLDAELGEVYTYAITASDIDLGDELQYSVLIKPDWLNFYPASQLLAGVANQLGSFPVTVRVSDGNANADQSFNIKVVSFSAINDLESDEPYSIFPNPASGYITVQLKDLSQDAEFKLFDVSGNQILQQMIAGSIETKIELNQEYIVPGVYIYKIVLSGEAFTGKLLIQR